MAFWNCAKKACEADSHFCREKCLHLAVSSMGLERGSQVLGYKTATQSLQGGKVLRVNVAPKLICEGKGESQAPNPDGCFFSFFFSFFFLGLHLQHMEVARLGVKSEL